MRRLESHYRRENGAYLIEIRLGEVRQLFQSLDPAPFREKDLDDRAEKYLVETSQAFPSGTRLRIVLHLPAAAVSPELESDVSEAVRHHFDYRAQEKAAEMSQALHHGRLSLLIGIAFLGACLMAREALAPLQPGGMQEILREGLLISGWVAMWRPIQIFLYDWWPILRMRRVFEALRDTPLEVRPVP